MSGTFKSSGSFSLKEISDFINTATGGNSVNPIENLKMGRELTGAPGQIFSNLAIWGANLPNGNLISPHRCGELYGANIYDSASTLDEHFVLCGNNGSYESVMTTDITNNKIPMYCIFPYAARNHWVKYTAKLYSPFSSSLGLTSTTGNAKHDFVFPEQVRDVRINPIGLLLLAENATAQRINIEGATFAGTNSYPFFKYGHTLEYSNDILEYFSNQEWWGLIWLSTQINARSDGNADDQVAASKVFDWFEFLKNLPNNETIYGSTVGIQYGNTTTVHEVKWKRSNINTDSVGKILIDPAILSSKSQGIGFAANSDSQKHIVLEQYEENDSRLIPQGYSKVLVQEGLVKMDNEEYLFTADDGTAYYASEFDILADGAYNNLGNFSFQADGITPLGIQVNNSTSFSVINGYDQSTGQATFSNKNSAISHWEEFVYNRRYFNFKTNLGGDFCWNHIYSKESTIESIAHFESLALPYINLGYNSSNRYLNSDNNRGARLPRSSDAGLKFQISYISMIPGRAKKEIELAAGFLEQVILDDLDIDIYILENPNTESFGSATLAAASPFTWDVGGLDGTYAKITSMAIFYDPVDFADETAYNLDTLGRTSIYNIVLHEMMHGLGVGYWEGSLGNPTYFLSNDYGSQYTGTHGVSAYQSVIASKNLNNSSYYYTYLPMQGETRGHIAEYSKTNESKIQPAFHNELMTPFYNGFDDSPREANPFSIISMGLLKDLGYTVNESLADSSNLLKYNFSIIPDESSSRFDQLNKKRRVCACGAMH